jgi:hypothetical protein
MADRKSRFDYSGPINKNFNKKPKRTLDRPKAAAKPKVSKPKVLEGALGKRSASPAVLAKPKASPSAVVARPKAKPSTDGTQRGFVTQEGGSPKPSARKAAPKPDAYRTRNKPALKAMAPKPDATTSAPRRSANAATTSNKPKPKRETSISISSGTSIGRALKRIISGSPSRTNAQRKKRADTIRKNAKRS